MTDDAPFPFRPRDWVRPVGDHRTLGRVREVRWYDGRVHIDVVLYDLDGTRIGRSSPVMGGPRTFEPALEGADWERIAEPDFPLVPVPVRLEDGRTVVRYHTGDALPPVAYVPRRRTARPRVRDDGFRRALERIADGHNDPRALAAEALGRPTVGPGRG